MTQHPPIVMIHGAFCGGWAFEAFRRPFERAGHAVHAPDLPGHAAGASRAEVQGLSVSRYAEAVVELCGGLSGPPILVGHSLGGLIVQLAAMRAPARALILLAPSPPWGVPTATPEEAFAAASLHTLGPTGRRRSTRTEFWAGRYLFDRLGEKPRAAAFERLGPESGRALFETLNWWLDPMAATLVRPKDISAPVLAIAGGRDVISPPVTVEAVARRLSGEVKVFPAMGHWLVGEPGFEGVARACLNWLPKVLAGRRASEPVTAAG